jgi:hypothetical protein
VAVPAYRPQRTLKQLETVDLLVIDELGYLSFNRSHGNAGVCSARHAARNSSGSSGTRPPVSSTRR